MKILLRYSENFFKIPVKKVVDLIDKYDKNNLISGYEVYISSLTNSKMNYIKEIAEIVKQKNQILNIRGISLENSIMLHYDFLKFYNKIANLLDKDITITYSPLCLCDKAEGVYKTNVILKRLIKNINDNSYRLNICIENIDEKEKQFTPFDVINIVKIVDNINFTYSIGNMYLKENQEYKLNRSLEKRLKNICINNLSDINSLRYLNIDFDKLFYYLNEIGYKNNFIINLDVDNIKGDNLEEKMISALLEVEKVDKINKMYQI